MFMEMRNCLLMFWVVLGFGGERGRGADGVVAAPAPARATIVGGATMGTQWHVRCWRAAMGDGGEKDERSRIKAAVEAKLAEFDRQVSTWREDSELSRFHHAAANEWFAVSAATAEMVELAIRFHRETDGACDVTLGPVSRLWGFGSHEGKPIRRPSKSPSDEQIKATLALTGVAHLQVRRQPPALRKDVAELEIDLSTLAPGYIVDALGKLLQTLGYENYLVEIGGEVCAAGVRQDGAAWQLGIERAGGRRRNVVRTIELKNAAAATAGDYRSVRTIDGVKVCHIIDPKTGRPLPVRNMAVTVVASTCVEADALDTALVVMGPEAGYDWCVKHRVAAYFQSPSAEGPRVVERSTPRLGGGR